MLKHFEKYTSEISEKDEILVLFIHYSLRAKPEKDRITAKNIIPKTNKWIDNANGHIIAFGNYKWDINNEVIIIENEIPKLTSHKLLKAIQFLRSTTQLPIIAVSSGKIHNAKNNKGYYTSYDDEDIFKECASLRQRARGVLRGADGMEGFASDENKHRTEECDCGERKIYECEMNCVEPEILKLRRA